MVTQVNPGTGQRMTHDKESMSLAGRQRGKMMNRKKSSLVVLLSCAMSCMAGAAERQTWYVSAANYGKAGMTGESETLAFGTIQDAVDAASANDIVYVLPGVYCQGDRIAWDGQRTRVFVDKPLTITSMADRGGKDATHIVGGYHSGTVKCGGDAIRCLSVTNLSGVVIEGFTIRDGAANNVEPASDASQNRGGGIVVYKQSTTSCLVSDCVFSNCHARLGGALNGATAVRCLFLRNRSERSAGGSCMRYSKAFNSVMSLNDGSALSYSDVSHCTVVCNKGYGSEGNNKNYIYNSILLGNTSGSVYGATTVNGCVTDADGIGHVMSPLTMDWRVIEGSVAETCADADCRMPNGASIPDKYQTFDFAGNRMPTGNWIAGAVQDAVSPKSGGLYFSTANSVDAGNGTVPGKPWAFFDVPLVQLAVRPVVPDGKSFFGFSRTGHAAGLKYAFPEEDGSVLLMPPSTPGMVVTNALETASVLYVDDDNYGKTGLDGSSKSLAFGTIQQAVDAASGRTIISLMPGVYDKGGSEMHGLMNRVAIPDTKSGLMIKSIEGAQSTIIKGEPDPESNGCGTGATRCICFQGAHYVKGVTLSDGYSASAQGSTLQRQGAASRGTGAASALIDCVIENCVGGDSVICNSTLVRCKVLNNRVENSENGIRDMGCDIGCVYSGNSSGASKKYLFSRANLRNCTILDELGLFTVVKDSSKEEDMVQMRNCIVYGAAAFGTSVSGSGNVLWLENPAVPSGFGHVRRNPLFADCFAGRVLPGSAAIGAGVADSELCWYFASDFDGKHFSSVLDGGFSAGAYQTPAPAAAIVEISSSDGCAIEGGTVGRNTLAEGGAVGFSPESDGRPYIGVVVNGETNLFAEAGGSVSVSFADVLAAGGMAIEALCLNEWYVDDDGSDDADGATPGTARRTLNGVLCDPCILPGDVVKVLPGVYRDDARKQSDGVFVAAVAVVPENVAVVATGDARETIIEGASASEAKRDIPQWTNKDGIADEGCGEDAVRCVYLSSGARISGFTLRGGRTRNVRETGEYRHYDVDYSGAAAMTASGAAVTPTVEDCLVVDCVGYRGGAFRYLNLVNCEITGCKAFYGFSAADRSSLYGCYVHDNTDLVHGPRQVHNPLNVWNCTLSDKLMNPADISKYSCWNTMFLGEAQATNGYYRCCAFVSGCGVKDEDMLDGSFVVEPENLEVDRSGRPVIGRNAAIDKANEEYSDYIGECDISGVQRVMNGRRDIGAFEADFRPVYAKIIGGKGFTVESVSAAVELSDEGTVVVPESAEIRGKWRSPRPQGSNATYEMNLRTAVSGIAEIAIGENPRQFAAGDHSYVFASSLAENSVAVKCLSGSAELLQGRWRVGLVLSVR